MGKESMFDQSLIGLVYKVMDRIDNEIDEFCDTDKFDAIHIIELFNYVSNNNDYLCEFPDLNSKSYDMAFDLLDEMFISDSLKNEIRRAIVDARDSRYNMLLKIKYKCIFPSYDTMLDYLHKYSELIKCIYLNFNRINGNGELCSKLLDFILNVDMSFLDDNEVNSVSLYNPVMLDGLRKLYKALEQYAKKANENRYLIMRNCCKDVIISKILRLFRWKIIHDNDIMQAAVRAYVPNHYFDDINKSLDIPVRKFKNYSSYDGIGELRLLDKIHYEIDRMLNNDLKENPIDICMAFLGDINEKPLQELVSVLNDTLSYDMDNSPEKFKNVRNIFIDVYTKNKPDMNIQCFDENGDYDVYSCDLDENALFNISYQFHDYNSHMCRESEYFIKSALDEVLNNHQIIFFLDICDFYSDFYLDDDVNEYVYINQLQRGICESYFRQENMDLKKEGLFIDLIRQLYGGQRYGKLGYLNKDINNGIINYIEKQWIEQNNNLKGAVYIFASDILAFEKKYYNSEKYIRVEHYNEKDIAVMRISKLEEEPLDLKKKESPYVIVFNMWQFIKHTSLRNMSSFKAVVKNGNKMKNDYKLVNVFKHIHIGIEYDSWWDTIYLYYQIDNQDVNEKKLQAFINKMILPFFEKGYSDMFNRFFLKVSTSFLYSDVKDVEDMLFLHLFVDKHEYMGRIKLCGKSDKLIKHKAKNCKYAKKRYYELVMKDYDTSSENFMGKYRKLRMLEKQGIKDSIFQNVHRACENLNYEKSYLYDNCKRMIR